MLLAPFYLHRRSGDETATTQPAAQSPLTLTTPFPDNARPRAVGFKEEDIPSYMIPVQSEHRVPETALRFTIRIAGERVVDPSAPA